MVIKGKARGGPVALAAHLERRDTNERVTLLELRGVASRDVLGALREMDCMGSGAASTRTLYHAAINTAPNERLTDEQKQRAADRLEKEMGFEGQPRIIVEHYKRDREHMHVIFLRIDTDRMVAIPDSHNYRKHEIVARDLEREFGHERVQGVHVDRDGKQRPDRTPYHHEMQQAERTGFNPHEAKKYVTKLWNQADSGKAFAAALAGEGWVLAKGDSRDFVLVDPAGETHSLARRIDGAKAADVRQRMSDVDCASLPKVAEAKEMQRRQAEAGRTNEKEKEKEKTKAPHAPDPMILKVAAPAEKSPALPLELAASTKQKGEKKPAPPLETDSKQARPKPAPARPPRASPIKRLYTAAIDKARSLFNKEKEVPEPIVRPAETAERPTPAPHPAKASGKPSPQLTPTQEAMRQPRAEARAADRKTSGAAIERPKESPTHAERDQSRERRHKLSREEIEMMFVRQRRQRERSGPSR
jgi:hypothetical protein